MATEFAGAGLVKDDRTPASIDRLITASMPDDLFVSVSDFMASELERQYKEAGLEVLAELGIANDERVVHDIDRRAVAYAHERAAELVGKRVTRDENGVVTVIDNPNADYSIADSTRDMLRSTVEQAVEGGWSTGKLADTIVDAFAFSDARAETIARTELAFAHVAAHTDVAKATGAVAKRSLLGSEHSSDVPDGDECDDAVSDGVIGIDEPFSNGALASPYHPNCVCDVEYIYADDPRAADFI